MYPTDSIQEVFCCSFWHCTKEISAFVCPFLFAAWCASAGCAVSRCLGGCTTPWECEPASQAASSTGLPSATAASSRHTAPTAHRPPLQAPATATPALEGRRTEAAVQMRAGVALLQATRTGHQQWRTPTEMLPGLLLAWGAGLVVVLGQHT